MKAVQDLCVTFFVEVNFERYYTASNQGTEIEEIQNIKQEYRNDKNEQHSHSGIFIFSYHRAQINRGLKVRSVKFQGFWSTNF